MTASTRQTDDTAATTRSGPFAPSKLVWWGVALLVLLSVPTLQRTFDFPLYNIIFLYLIFFWVTQATSWNIFCGYSGYFSFGQGAFYGSGLYVTAILVSRHDFTLFQALPFGALLGGVIAFLSGLLVFRLRTLKGEIFALFSLAIALGLGALANNWRAIDGGRGISIGRVEYPDWLGSVPEMMYYVGLMLAIGAVFTAYAVQHSRFGYGLFAIRDDERVAEGIGVPTLRYKLIIFTLNGVIAGVSGALHAVQVNFVAPSGAFSIRVPLFVILMSVIGGRRHWLGPVIGAVLIYTVTDRMVGAGFSEANQIILAIVLIGATLFLRGGIVVRLIERPRPALISFVLAWAAQIVLGSASLITQFAISMVVVLVVLLLPDRLYARLDPRASTTSDAADEDGSAPATVGEDATGRDDEEGGR